MQSGRGIWLSITLTLPGMVVSVAVNREQKAAGVCHLHYLFLHSETFAKNLFLSTEELAKLHSSFCLSLYL